MTRLTLTLPGIFQYLFIYFFNYKDRRFLEVVRYRQAQVLLTNVLETVLLQALQQSLQELEGTTKTEKLCFQLMCNLQLIELRGSDYSKYLWLLLAVFLFTDTLLTLVSYESFSRNAVQAERLSTSIS